MSTTKKYLRSIFIRNKVMRLLIIIELISLARAVMWKTDDTCVTGCRRKHFGWTNNKPTCYTTLKNWKICKPITIHTDKVREM